MTGVECWREAEDDAKTCCSVESQPVPKKREPGRLRSREQVKAGCRPQGCNLCGIVHSAMDGTARTASVCICGTFKLVWPGVVQLDRLDWRKGRVRIISRDAGIARHQRQAGVKSHTVLHRCLEGVQDDSRG